MVKFAYNNKKKKYLEYCSYFPALRQAKLMQIILNAPGRLLATCFSSPTRITTQVDILQKKTLVPASRFPLNIQDNK